jgi:hypothetical protein
LVVGWYELVTNWNVGFNHFNFRCGTLVVKIDLQGSSTTWNTGS